MTETLGDPAPEPDNANSDPSSSELRPLIDPTLEPEDS